MYYLDEIDTTDAGSHASEPEEIFYETPTTSPMGEWMHQSLLLTCKLRCSNSTWFQFLGCLVVWCYSFLVGGAAKSKVCLAALLLTCQGLDPLGFSNPWLMVSLLVAILHLRGCCSAIIAWVYESNGPITVGWFVLVAWFGTYTAAYCIGSSHRAFVTLSFPLILCMFWWLAGQGLPFLLFLEFGWLGGLFPFRLLSSRAGSDAHKRDSRWHISQ